MLSQTISAAGFTATQTYTYDGVNRLDTSTEGTRRRNHGYDQYGNNWVSLNENLLLSGMTPVAQSWFNAANNQIVGYAYEPSGTGNLTGANGWTYAYDGENLLKQAETTVNGTTYTNTYQYDGEGRRVKKTVGAINTVYVYDAMGQMIAEYTDDTATPTAGTQYLMTDHLGSTRAVLDSTTNIVSCHDYLPFGEELTAGRESVGCYTNTDSVKQKFTGKERHTETGLDFFGARYLSSAQGRWTSPDWSEQPSPVPFANLHDPQTLNLYSYVRNNPANNVDLNGHDELEEGACGRMILCADSKEKVGVDPGHGDKNQRNKQIDPGAVDDKEYEKDYALKVANGASDELKRQKVDVFQTRAGDITVDGPAVMWRINAAHEEGVTILVSIHMDSVSGAPSRTGMAVVYASPAGKQLGQDIIDANTVMPSRGVKADVRSLAVPKYKGGVGVIVEVGFINSATDRALVNKNAQKIGADIASGIVKYLSRSKEK